MTATHIPPDEAVTAAEGRHAFMLTLTDAAIWAETHLDAELPECRTLTKKVYGLTYGDKLEHLYRIAKGWGVPVTTARDGVKMAVVEFGTAEFGVLRFAATVSPPDATYLDYLDRISQRPGTEAAA